MISTPIYRTSGEWISVLSRYDHIVTDIPLDDDRVQSLQSFQYQLNDIEGSVALVLLHTPVHWFASVISDRVAADKYCVVLCRTGVLSYTSLQPSFMLAVDGVSYYDRSAYLDLASLARQSIVLITSDILGPDDQLEMHEGWSTQPLLDDRAETLVITPLSLMYTLGTSIQRRSDSSDGLAYHVFSQWSVLESMLAQLTAYQSVVLIADVDEQWARDWLESRWPRPESMRVVTPDYDAITSVIPELQVTQARGALALDE